jgi:anti-sigma-K factor RskA
MTTADRQELLRDLLGELPADRAEKLAARLAVEPELAAARRDLAERWQTLELPPTAPAPRSFAARVRARAEAEAKEARAGWFGFGTGWLPVTAAAAVLAAGVALGAWLGAGLATTPTPTPTVAVVPVVASTVATQPEPERIAALPEPVAADEALAFGGDSFADAYFALLADEDVAQ